MCDEIEMTPEQEEQEMAEFGLPDELHVHAMIQAVEDTTERQIEGNEHLALTDFQVYAGTVLSMNGVKGLSTVSGQEGFFSAIGDGFRKTWEYIKKMFKSIWNFFFGKETEKVLDEASKEIADAGVAMSEAVKDGSADEISKEEAEQLEADITKMVETKKEFLLRIKDFSVEKIKEGMQALPDGQAIGLAIAANYDQLYKSTEAFIKKYGSKTINWTKEAHTVSAAFVSELVDLKKLNKTFEANKTKMASFLAKVEQATKTAVAEGYEKGVAFLKKLMVSAASSANYIRTSTNQMVGNTKKTLRAYGLAATIAVGSMRTPKLA